MFLYTLMVFALTKPFIYNSSTLSHKKGRDLIIVLDASGSMAQSGFNPDDRLASKFNTNIALASNFISNRYDDNVGVVLFGTFAYTASPLTYDLDSLIYVLGMTNVGIAGESTALGDAIMQAIRTLSFGEAKSKAIILLTDGYHNAGETSPKVAVTQAKKLGIKVYTIGLGKGSNFDASLLKTIASETKAKSYIALDTKKLQDIYKEINKLEPSNIRSEQYLQQDLLISFPLLLSFILLLGWTYWMQRRDT
ncbi:MAG: VWA domain-containing protein [Sulfurovum sp.]|nr:VWA domain-containing protein [Sulfurovum sp.]